MKNAQDSWWDEQFRPDESREGIDFVSRDAKTVVDVQRRPQGVRGLYAGLVSLGMFLAQEPSLKRACLIIDATRFSRERLRREWHGLQTLFVPEIAKRLSLIGIGKGETVIEPDDPYLHRMAVAFKTAHPFDSGGQLPSEVPRRFGRQRYFDVVKVLLVRWLQREGPIALGKLAQTVGCTYPTIREALRRLDRKQYIKRHSNRTVELSRFPHDTWNELIALSSRIRTPVRFVDRSGQKSDPHFLLKQLERIRPSSVAVGGVVAAALWHSDFDLHGVPRLDLVVHSPAGATDLGFIRRLDPALKETEAVNDAPVLVVHPLFRAEPLFQTRQELQMPIADPLETALDLVEMGLTVQAGQMLQHFRKECRIS